MIELPDWVSAYVGLPFKEGGRHRDGLDCYGLLRLVINERFGGTVPEYEGIAYRPGEDRGLLAALMDERIRLWRPIANGTKAGWSIAIPSEFSTAFDVRLDQVLEEPTVYLALTGDAGTLRLIWSPEDSAFALEDDHGQRVSGIAARLRFLSAD